MVAIRVNIKIPIMLPIRVAHVELVELDMVNFDVLLGMCWLHDCFAFIYCTTRIIKFKLPN